MGGPVGGGASETGTLVDILAQRDLDLTHPALICGDVELTYAEFEARSNRAACALIDRGVGPEVVVAVGIRRSIDFVIAAWGVIKSGAAYVPVDPAYPAERVAFMLEDSEAPWASRPATSWAARSNGWTCRHWSPRRSTTGPSATGNAVTRSGLTDLAYLIYTSGSTGKPKAVAVSNSGLASLVGNVQEITGSRLDDPDTRVLCVASPSFDASVFELLWALTAGHTLVIALADDYAGTALDAVIEAGEVTGHDGHPVGPGLARSGARGNRAQSAPPARRAPELVERWDARAPRVQQLWTDGGDGPVDPRPTAARQADHDWPRAGASPPESSTPACTRSPTACSASCTWRPPAWRAAASAAPGSQRRASSPTRSAHRGRGLYKPATSSGSTARRHRVRRLPDHQIKINGQRSNSARSRRYWASSPASRRPW